MTPALRHRKLQATLLPVLVTSVCGCGYSSERPFETAVENVHVELFRSKVFWRDVEYKLTEAVIKRIEMDTPYRVVDRKIADSLLTGEVLEIKQATLGDDFRTGLPRETGVTFVVNFRWQDLHSGKMLAQRDRFIHTTTYIRPVGETFYEGSIRGLDGLAERLVEVAMESPW